MESWLKLHIFQQLLLAHLDGSTEKLEELVEAGDQAEAALNILVMLSQLLLLRGELRTDKALFAEAASDFSQAYSISLKICDEVLRQTLRHH